MVDQPKSNPPRPVTFPEIGALRKPNPETGQPMCHMRWGPVEWYVSAQVVQDAARDLAVCAAYADMLTGALRVGKDAEYAQRLLVQAVTARYGPAKMFGHLDVVQMAPAADSRQRQGLVMLRRGGLDAIALPEEAEAIADEWRRVAAGSITDCQITAALEDVLELPEHRIDAVFSWARMLNSGGPDPEKLLREEAARQDPPEVDGE